MECWVSFFLSFWMTEEAYFIGNLACDKVRAKAYKREGPMLLKIMDECRGGMGDERMESGEGLNKGEDRLMEHPLLPEPPPWSDRGARVGTVMFQENRLEGIWSFYKLFYFLMVLFTRFVCLRCFVFVGVYSFRSTIIIHNSGSYYVVRRIYMNSDCCVTSI
ncbi:unnamed protein product [Cuscuta europaea]|uniref:Uncharacterized protein n=1 Tax=Cuscuta europaea TaxID=41803 RepID=A0A9P0YM72_CUSEU|nr:unnamed protein product [Cuscuta europaea]